MATSLSSLPPPPKGQTGVALNQLPPPPGKGKGLTLDQIGSTAPKKDFLEKAAGAANSIFPGTQAIGESLTKAGTNIKNLVTGGVKGFEAGLSENTVDVPRLATAYAGNAAQIGLAAAPVAGAGASFATRLGTGLATGYASDVAAGLARGESEPLKAGAGTLVGGSIPVAGAVGRSLVRFGQGQAPRIINSLIKPLAKDFSYGSNPGRVVSEMGIVAKDFDELGTKISEARQGVGQEIGRIGAELSNKPIINLGDSLSPIDDAIRTAASQNNSALLNRLQGVKKAITHELEPIVGNDGNVTIAEKAARKLNGLTFQESRDILRSVGDVTQFTGNPSDDKAVNAALKRVYGNIKGHTLTAADSLDPAKAKEFRKLTEQYADLTSAKVATDYRDKIVQRSNLTGLSPTVIGIGSGVLTMLATGGAATPAIIAGLGGATLDKLASSPAFKTKLAAILSKKSAEEVRSIYQVLPGLKKILPLAASKLTTTD